MAPAPRPFRFLAEAGAVTDGRALADAARRAEASGIDVLVLPREAAGERFDQLELNTYPSISPIIVTDHARREGAKLARRLAARTGIEVSSDELLDSPHIFIGSVEQLVEKFRSLRERLGISSIMVGTVDELPAVVERLAGT